MRRAVAGCCCRRHNAGRNTRDADADVDAGLMPRDSALSDEMSDEDISFFFSLCLFLCLLEGARLAVYFAVLYWLAGWSRLYEPMYFDLRRDIS